MIVRRITFQSNQYEMNMMTDGYYGAIDIYEMFQYFNLYMLIAEAVYKILFHDFYQ